MSLLLALTASGGGIAYSLSGAAGSYTLTGKAGTLGLIRKLAGSSGSYSVAGQAGALAIARKLSGAAGSYSITGQSGALSVTRKLTGSAGVYAYSGLPATLTRLVRLSGSSGSYVISGVAAEFALIRGERSSGGWFDYPDRPIAKRQEHAKKVILRVKQEAPSIELQEEVSGVAEELKAAIYELEIAAQAYANELKRKEAEKSNKQARALRRILIDAQLQAEQIQQQIEELDIAYIMMMMAYHE